MIGAIMILAVVFMAHGAVARTVILKDIRYWSGPERTRIVFETSGKATFRSFKSKRSGKLVVDFRNLKVTRYRPPKFIKIDDGIVASIALVHNARKRTLRAILALKAGVRYKIISLKPSFGKAYRVVVDVFSPEREAREATERVKAVKRLGISCKIVVVDAGHGGIDPGAIGRRGTKEKDVTLKVAKKVVSKLNRMRGIRAFLTRKGDYYISLRKRTQIAREYGAHLFVSIHADASRNRSARGASVYCLSEHGATDEAARLLARNENLSDLLAGMPASSDRRVNSIILDMLQTRTINESLKAAETVIHELAKVCRLKFKTPRQAAFVVLKAPEIPCVLVETGYISNWADELLLRNSRFQEKVSSAIANACFRYLKTVRPQAPPLKYRYHIVRKNETLWRISQKYNIDISAIKQANNIGRDNRIYVGQKLLLPL